MRSYLPGFIKLSGQTPFSQCLCDYCENCELLLKSLHAIGMKGLPGNKYNAIDVTVCDLRQDQFGSMYKYPLKTCIYWQCENCGLEDFRNSLKQMNLSLWQSKDRISWHRWQSVEGMSAPQKCLIKGSVPKVIDELIDVLHGLSSHLFRLLGTEIFFSI